MNTSFMKRTVCFLLVLFMLIGMMPMPAFATEATQETETVDVVSESTEVTEAPDEESAVPGEGEDEEESSEPSEAEEDEEVIHTHDYTTVVTAPTCTEQGYTTHTCDCDESYVDDYTDATGEHTYANGICAVCGGTEPEQPAPKGDVISILGDSISTFSGYIPSGNAAYYPKDTVQNVADTWWMQLITELNADLGVNESWSGSYVSETANSKPAMASLERIQSLGSNGTPDVIIFFGGTNDIAFKRPLGSFDPASAPVQTDLTATTWDSLADGYTEAILRMQHYYPEARIISILPTINKTYYNNATLEQHNAVLRAICDHYGVEYVDLVAAGFTAVMLGDATHPNATGMDFITAAAKKVLQSEHFHGYTAVVTEPTCAEQGYTTYTCDCGESYVDDYVDATNEHSYKNGICAVCGGKEPEQPAPEGDVISILGDSISTFNGFLPEGNAAYYPKNTVQNVTDTWWMQLITELNARLGVNESWSGSYVSETKETKPAMASLERIQNLGSNGTPDVIFFFGGTNDIAFKRPLGSFDPASAPDQADLTATTWESLADGYVAAILRMRHYYPDARIISILPTVNKSYYNNATLEQHNAVLRKICEHYDVEYVDLVAAGFTTAMLGDATHPSAAGMDFITDAVKAVYTMEAPNDCADGHQFGDWTECTTSVCQQRYVRECAICGEKQNAKDITEQTVSFAVPAITANVGDLVNLSLYAVAFDAASVIPAAELTWTGEAVENGCVIPAAAGVYALTASAGENSKAVYLVVKNPEDTEYVLYYDDFDNAALDGYRAIEVPSGTEYYVSDGKLILDATGNTNNHMRVLLPEWIGDFGDYEITTSFSMLSAMKDTYWFAVMARIQNEDFPYWQAAIRQNATASNGVEISTRTKASGVTGGWNVTHKTAMVEKLNASKYYTQTFGLSGKNGFHAINGKTLLESNAITNTVGGVGFHLRASKVAVDSIKILLPFNDSAHSFGDWTVIREATCTNAGEESRTCSQCGATENREIAAGHILTKYEQKLPTCTEPGWSAYESCSRCDYTTYKEFAAPGHTYERDIHSVAHRGYSDVAPENTLIAYRMAKEYGFRYVECDVSLTSDKKAVLLHDSTINRTSNSTGSISKLTYEQLLQYDFGSWKGEEFAGTKIPTLEEFLELCVELDLHPYIELKTSGYTKAEITSLVQLVERCGLLDDCTWISFNSIYLGYIKDTDPTARLGYLRRDDATASVIKTAKGLRTEKNEVFLDLAYDELTEAGLLQAMENGFAVEVWTVDDETTVKSQPASIVGFTSNALVAEKILTNAQRILPTCTEQGYTIYTCTCGESYVDDYVDPTGEHSYENGVCGNCGATQAQSIVITRQPAPATAVIGETATLSVEAQGEELHYQWYYRDAGNANFTQSSVQESTYKLTVKATNASRELYCVITDAQGNRVTTDTVKLIQPLPEELKIVTQPASDYALIGETATVTMEVQGTGLTYQWYYRDLPGGSLTKSTTTSATYSLTVKPTYVNREIYCVITDAHGNQVTTDTVKLLHPLRESLEIVKQPVSSTAAIGETATVSVEAKGEGLTYQWYFRNTPNGALSKSSITGNSYSVTVAKSNAQRVVYCVITDGHGNKVTTETVALRMDAPAEEPQIYFTNLNDALTGTGGSASPRRRCCQGGQGLR